MLTNLHSVHLNFRRVMNCKVTTSSSSCLKAPCFLSKRNNGYILWPFRKRRLCNSSTIYYSGLYCTCRLGRRATYIFTINVYSIFLYFLEYPCGWLSGIRLELWSKLCMYIWTYNGLQQPDSWLLNELGGGEIKGDQAMQWQCVYWQNRIFNLKCKKKEKWNVNSKHYFHWKPMVQGARVPLIAKRFHWVDLNWKLSWSKIKRKLILILVKIIHNTIQIAIDTLMESTQFYWQMANIPKKGKIPQQPLISLS